MRTLFPQVFWLNFALFFHFSFFQALLSAKSYVTSSPPPPSEAPVGEEGAAL